MELTQASILVDKCLKQLLELQNLKRHRHRRKALSLLKEHLEDYNALLSLDLDLKTIQMLRKQYPSSIQWIGLAPLCQSQEEKDKNEVIELLFNSLLKVSSMSY